MTHLELEENSSRRWRSMPKYLLDAKESGQAKKRAVPLLPQIL
jgi:hypothetical protein